MKTVAVPQKKYEILERQAALYRRILKKTATGVFPIELYSQKRLAELLKEDHVNSTAKQQVKKLFRR